MYLPHTDTSTDTLCSTTHPTPVGPVLDSLLFYSSFSYILSPFFSLLTFLFRYTSNCYFKMYIRSNC